MIWQNVPNQSQEWKHMNMCGVLLRQQNDVNMPIVNLDYIVYIILVFSLLL